MNNNFRNPHRRLHYASAPALPRFSTPLATLQEEHRGAHDPFWTPTENTPLGLMSLSLQPPSRVEVLVLNNNRTQPQTQEHTPRPSQGDQTDPLKKLRKEVYNPGLKRITTRLCLYYRDQAANIAKQMAREREEEGKRCAVCLEDFEPKETVMITPCNHMFHEDCIVPWVKSQARCPVCRAAIGEPAESSSDNGSFSNADLIRGEDLISILRAMGAM